MPVFCKNVVEDTSGHVIGNITYFCSWLLCNGQVVGKAQSSKGFLRQIIQLIIIYC